MDDESTKTGKHSWSLTVENIGCALILAVFVLAVIVVCTWGAVHIRSTP
jgi:hypothetical protein